VRTKKKETTFVFPLLSTKFHLGPGSYSKLRGWIHNPRDQSSGHRSGCQ